SFPVGLLLHPLRPPLNPLPPPPVPLPPLPLWWWHYRLMLRLWPSLLPVPRVLLLPAACPRWRSHAPAPASNAVS
ncbi:unnamed protein product, partial [Coccothraustes coccothraustes]